MKVTKTEQPVFTRLYTCAGVDTGVLFYEGRPTHRLNFQPFCAPAFLRARIVRLIVYSLRRNYLISFNEAVRDIVSNGMVPQWFNVAANNKLIRFKRLEGL